MNAREITNHLLTLVADIELTEVVNALPDDVITEDMLDADLAALDGYGATTDELRDTLIDYEDEINADVSLVALRTALLDHYGIKPEHINL
jgi:hypothetical protein